MIFDKETIQILVKEFSLMPKTKRQAYSYLLGQYLGDGWIGSRPRTYSLVFSTDSQYPKIVVEILQSLQVLFPEKVVYVRQPRKHSKALSVKCYSQIWPVIFPQHGLGRKHDRRIRLTSWQRGWIDPRFFIKGLIHSDGCYFYTYLFTNKSKDIYRIFQQACEWLELDYSYYPRKQHENSWGSGECGVTRLMKDSAEELYEFVGAKE